MKVIFLDFDGVICVGWNTDGDEYGQAFRKDYVENLREVVEKTGAKIVVSSSWRTMGLNRLKTMWELRDMPGEVIDRTPSLWTQRGEEIAEYLRENPCDKYVIIDDDSDFLPEQKPFCVKTSCNKHEDAFRGLGLTKECTKRAIEILTP